MQALKNTFLSLLLLTASRVTGSVITTASTAVVTLYGIGPIPENGNQKMVSASAISFDEESGGTVYEEKIIVTEPQTGTRISSPTTTKVDTFTGLSLLSLVVPSYLYLPTQLSYAVTVTQASAWLYQVARPTGPISDSDAESFNSKCITEISWEEFESVSHHITGFLDQTTTYIGQIIPMYTLTGPAQTPTTTTTSAATMVGSNPMFNRLSSIFLGMFIVVMLVLDF